MAEVSYERLFNQTLVHVPNCPEPTVLVAVRDAVIEFCTDTLVLTRRFDPLSVEANEPTVLVDAPAGYDVLQVVGPIYFNGRRLVAKSGYEEDWNTQDWAALTAEEPKEYVCFAPNEITLIPTPTVSADNAITGRAAYAPNHTSTRADSLVVDGYRHAISQGALSRLLAIPDQPYTNVEKAMVYGKMFGAAKANAAASARASFVSAPMRVKFPGF